jgi:hypothetical protein
MITLALWMQWHYLYCVLDDYVRAVKMLESKVHSWVLLIVCIVLSILLLVEAMFVHKDTEENGLDEKDHKVAGSMQAIMGSTCLLNLVLFVYLYIRFCILIKRDEGYSNLWCQVNGFFSFMIVIIVARMTSHLITTYSVYYKDKYKDPDQYTTEEIVGSLFYINCIIEMTLNILVLYYRIKTQMNTEE